MILLFAILGLLNVYLLQFFDARLFCFDLIDGGVVGFEVDLHRINGRLFPTLAILPLIQLLFLFLLFVLTRRRATAFDRARLAGGSFFDRVAFVVGDIILPPTLNLRTIRLLSQPLLSFVRLLDASFENNLL